MMNTAGSNIQDIKLKNRMLVLKIVATNHGISRSEIAKYTGLSKMAVSKIVSELIGLEMIAERPYQCSEKVQGRRPIMLTISSNSPCICGILIKRGLCQFILANLNGNIFEQINYKYKSLRGEEELLDIITVSLKRLLKRTKRRVLAIGISSVGPIDSFNGNILNPPFFYGIENLQITSIIRNITSIPTFLVNDANAGALAEKLYGIGKNITNFTYLHIMNGIGAGFILQDKLYHGDTGQSGEIGHTSINFSGPKCDCGNSGCLDLYANTKELLSRMKELSSFYVNSSLIKLSDPNWMNIVDAGNRGDSLAVTLLDEFCSYISYALVDTLNLLDLSNIIVGYDSNTSGKTLNGTPWEPSLCSIIEKLLENKISNSILSSKYRKIHVYHSCFEGNAPLIGAIATIADKIFSLQFIPDEFIV